MCNIASTLVCLFALVLGSYAATSYEPLYKTRQCIAPFFSVNNDQIIACYSSNPGNQLSATVKFATDYTAILHPTTYGDNYCYIFNLPYGHSYPISVKVDGFACRYGESNNGIKVNCGWDICDYESAPPAPLALTSRGTSCPDEKTVLSQLYDALGGSSWNRSDNWKQGNPCTNSWYGVTCDSNGRVNFLDLRSNNLVGEQIPASIGCLQFLKGLHFDNNYIKGEIPPTICDLANTIQYITMQHNFISGSIPKCFSGLVHLLHLYLEYNRLSGELPDFSQYRGIKELHVEYNCLTGYIPQIIEISQVIDMDFRGNNFYGCIPDFYRNLWVLLEANRFCTEPIPCWLKAEELGCGGIARRNATVAENKCRSVNACSTVIA